MKQRMTSLLMALALALTLLPAAALAASGDGGSLTFANWRQVWLYECRADQDADRVVDSAGDRTEKPAPLGSEAGENIREIPGTLVYDLGSISPDGAGGETLTLTFENVAQKTSELGMHQTHQSTWGQVYLTASQETAHFDLEWNNKNSHKGGELPEYGDTCTVTITPKKGLGGGTYTDWILFMEQNSRVGWTIQATVTVEREEQTVRPAAKVSKTYGKVLSAADIPYTVEGGDETGVMSKLGVVLSGQDGVGSKSPAGTYSLSYPEKVETDRYVYTILGGTELTVEPTAPEMSSVSVYHVGDGETLADYAIVGKYVNPYTRETVAGVCAWDQPGDTPAEDGMVYPYTFTPNDGNHQPVRGTAKARAGVVASTPTTQDVTIDVVEDSRIQEYAGRGSARKIQYTTNLPADVAKRVAVWYNDGSGWVQSAPSAVGTYKVDIRFGGYYDGTTRVNYSAAAAETTLTITPKTISPVFSVYTHAFDGTTKAQIESFGFKQVGLALADADTGEAITRTNVEEYFQANFDTPEAGKNKPVTVTLREGKRVKLTGENAQNYRLSDDVIGTAVGEITPRSIALTLNDGVSKYYGQTMTFVASDFTASGTFCNGDVLESIELTADSDGASSAAEVASYDVTASSGNANYIVTGVAGRMSVERAVPIPVEVTAETGTIGEEAASIEASLQGVFVNPYSGMTVPGSVKLAAGEAGRTLAEETELTYVFTPADKTNHTTYTGAVTVSSIKDTPAPIEILGETAFTYDGQAHAVVPAEVEGVRYTVTYDGGEEAPSDVGRYTVTVTADASENDRYVDSQREFTLNIDPATPTVTVETPEVEAGTKLGEIVPAYTAWGVDGETVRGTLEWSSVGGVSAGEVHVTDGASFGWVFTPDSENYAVVTGSVQVAVDAPAQELPEEPAPGGEGDDIDDSDPASLFGTLGNNGDLDWKVDGTENTVTVQGEIPADDLVWAVCYDAEGRFLGIYELNAKDPEATLDPNWASFKLIWLGGQQTPQCSAAGGERQ